MPHLPDSLFQRPTKLTAAEVTLRSSIGKMGRVLTPYRAGVTTDGLKHNKYRSRCFGRGACNRRVGGCDIHAAFDSPTGLIYPAMDTGNLTLRTNAVAREVLVDAEDRKGTRRRVRRCPNGRELRGTRNSRRPRRIDARVCAADAPLEVDDASKRYRQFERSRRTQLLRARHGTERDRPGEGPDRQTTDARRWAARRFLRSPLQKPFRQAIRTSSVATGSKAEPEPRCFPARQPAQPGFGAAFKKTVRDRAGAYI